MATAKAAPKKKAILKDKPEEVPYMRYEIVSSGCLIELVRLIKTFNGKVLPRPIYEFAYLNRKENKANMEQDKPNFRTYLEEINRSVGFKNWKPIDKS